MYRFSFILFFIIILCQTVDATDYYVSSSDISANDLNNGTSPATPWKSISKVNSAFLSLKPGDRLLFNRGDVFYGSIIITKSGISGSPITIGTYGTGENPILTGFTELSNWINEEDQIWSSECNSEAQTNIVTINDILVPMGRTPNFGSFLTYESHSTIKSITDNQLLPTPNWTGAEVVINKNDWTWDRCSVASHIEGTLTYNNLGSSDEPLNNRKYFIQNDIKCLDKDNEWYHSIDNNKFYIYGNPTQGIIKIATIKNLIYNNGFDYIVIENLNLHGAIEYGIYMPYGSTNCTIQNCNITYIGNCAVYSQNASLHIYDKLSINNCNRIGIHAVVSNNFTITNNKITNIGLILGGAYRSDLNGIYINNTNNVLVDYNDISNIAQTGIKLFGNNVIISHNLINYSCKVLTDAGGIYTWGNKIGRIINDNIILNSGVGNNYKLAEGIYLDELTSNVIVKNNSIANCINSGIKVHRAYDNVITNNTSFNNQSGIFFGNWSGAVSIYGNSMNDNIFFAKLSTQFSLQFITTTNDIATFGTANNNFYARPIDDDDVFVTNQPSTGTKYRTLEGWQSFTGKDLNSHKSPIAITDVNTILFEYNATKTDKIVTLTKPMIDVTGKKYTGSVTLAPYTSIILMVDPNPAQTMTPVYQSSVIENASPSILTMTYDQTLANVIPPVSAFKVIINSSLRTVSKVSISGTKVQLTLASPIVYGDKVTIEYIKPSSNPFLQATSGDPADSISAQNVTNNVNPPNPVYVSSVVENANPSRIDITYNLTLKSVSIATSAFSVKVNTITRTVSSVSISGPKVYLTLASPIVYGDIVTVAYTKPSTNFIQTPDGGQAVSFTAKPVTNNVNPIQPVYVSSVIEDAAPDKLVMTYNLSLANTTPAPEAFSILVDNTTRTVTAVAISGTQVTLTLASAVVFGNIVTVAYTKPALSPLQTTSGAYAATISAQPVTNNVADNSQNLFPPVIAVSFESSAFSGFVYEIDASGSSDPNGDVLSFSWNPPSDVPVSSTTGSRIRFLAPVVTSQKEITIALSVNDGTTSQSKNLSINILPYKPELSMGKVDIVEASNSYSTDIPDKAIDSDLATKWSMDGDNHWLRFDLPGPFKMSHLMLAFLPEQKFESYFDIFVSQDNISWEPVLLNAKSCNFSGAFQVFDFPLTKTSTDYTSVKLIGHGNSSNTWNYFSEFKIFGTPGEDINDPLSPHQENIYIYPNPADDFINVQVLEPFDKVQHLRIFDFSGRLCHESRLDAGLNNIQIPLDLKSGVYIAQVILGKLITFSQKLLVID